MKPFKFTPIFKTVVWGGNKIAQYKGITTNQQNIGESWELSGVKGDESIVAEGHYSGWSLPELINHFKGELVGEDVYRKHGDEFPLLIKLIDARDDLSIQVHPNDKLSHLRHSKKGKTEMWYVINAEKDASLKSGLNKSVTPEEYIQLIDSDKITEVLQEHRVQKGDVFFLPAGRIHAIGAGTLIAEIQ